MVSLVFSGLYVNRGKRLLLLLDDSKSTIKFKNGGKVRGISFFWGYWIHRILDPFFVEGRWVLELRFGGR